MCINKTHKNIYIYTHNIHILITYMFMPCTHSILHLMFWLKPIGWLRTSDELSDPGSGYGQHRHQCADVLQPFATAECVG